MNILHNVLKFLYTTNKYKKRMEYNRVKQLVLDKEYKFFEEGDYNLNIVAERTNAVITNYFTDYLHILYKVDGEPKIHTIPFTTKPGIKGSIDSPNTVEGVTGTAIIIPGQYRSAFKYVKGYDYRKYPFNQPHFRQIKGLKYWRDGDKDLVIDEVQEQVNKIFYTHIHIMSQPGKSGFPVNNWSKGCMGYEEPQAKTIDDIVNIAIFKWGDIFTVTLIEIYK